MPLDSCFKDAKKFNDRTMTMTPFTNRCHLTILPYCESRLFASSYEYSYPLPSSFQDFNLLPKKSFQFCEVFVRLDRETLHGLLLHELFRKTPPNLFPSHTHKNTRTRSEPQSFASTTQQPLCHIDYPTTASISPSPSIWINLTTL